MKLKIDKFLPGTLDTNDLISTFWIPVTELLRFAESG
jgi:hypothetical protein